jgi:hypothetical protein
VNRRGRIRRFVGQSHQKRTLTRRGNAAGRRISFPRLPQMHGPMAMFDVLDVRGAGVDRFSNPRKRAIYDIGWREAVIRGDDPRGISC